MEELKGYDFVDFDDSSKSFDSYLDTLKRYKYCISPPGNGIDCHRHWESLYLNTYPIVVNNNTFKKWKDLKFIEVDDYLSLEEIFKIELSEFPNTWEYLDMNFWKTEIEKLIEHEL